MEDHVEFLLLAEFDIDEGSLLSVQYPTATGIEEQCLAELMLPDGAHNREEDWTVFFINRDENEQVLGSSAAAASESRADEAAERQVVLEAWTYQFNPEMDEWQQLDDDMKLLVLLPTEIIVCQRNREELLVLSCDEAIEYRQLEPTFSVAMTSEAAVAFRFASPEDDLIFLEHCELLATTDKAVVEQDTPDVDDEVEGAEDSKPPFLYCMNLVRTQKNAEWTRGAKVKAMAICSKHQYMHVFKPLLILALEQYFVTPEVAVIEDLFNAINSMDLRSLPQYSLAEKKLLRASTSDFGVPLVYSSHVKYGPAKIPVKVPLIMLPDEVSEQSIVPLIHKFGEEIMTIYNALLLERRVIFLGYGHPAGEVCDAVLGAMSMVSPPLPAVIKRTFPYTNLVNLDFLQLSSFCAGTTNLIFQQREDWWDVLCDLETGKVVLSQRMQLERKENPSNHASQDTELFAEVMFAVENHYGASKILGLFQEYTQFNIDLARARVEFPNTSLKSRTLDCNRKRTDKLKRTATFKHYVSLSNEAAAESALQGADVELSVAKLRVQRLDDDEMLRVFQEFIGSVVSDAQITEFLQFFPEDRDGLAPLGTGLFHASEEVRALAVELLSRIEKNKYGRILVQSLNKFILSAFRRNQFLVG
ncbi:uncharacterized protein AMSG_09499 [Thecamonas trahens ATCC 50062]|uniref:UDENN domain-containing protein n=1 Tax=Thecamonas trahens ATCC 50062 TaxID=461836 RepID=A0A0L0DP29_THETB|nr:hypothetical protein AMSG_09499 [Thecamonas trahens ATCC 50062]KNC53781.1 hypothetical protein AMSG_09499 [Thecamonas trahens ATCC 50062]|eukprot:XP_013754343.1 hypothetical protein AMSG_09499 [Thecamonas trahens ATCC 50062]